MQLLMLKKCLFSHGKKAWYLQHKADYFVKKAQQSDYRSRAAFKLIELHYKYKIIPIFGNILDLGAAPGSWSQVVRYIAPYCRIVAVDLLEVRHLIIYMREIEGVKIYRCDARSDKLLTELKKDYGEFNGVISDMAPNFSGTLFETHQYIIQLNLLCLQNSVEIGDKDCSLTMKTVQGHWYKCLVALLEIYYEEVYRVKPKSSRPESVYHFIVAKHPRTNINNYRSQIRNILQLENLFTCKNKKEMIELIDSSLTRYQ